MAFSRITQALTYLLPTQISQQSASAMMQRAQELNLYTTTASELRLGLDAGHYTSEQLVQVYLAQIAAHNHKGHKLNAIISVRPEESVLANARQLDEERSQNRLRSGLHGIPIILKDNMLTGSFDMGTTSGTLALQGLSSSHNASLALRLERAGCIILAKGNLSELGNMKGTAITSGWSPVGGQTQSPYVIGGVQPDDTWFGHSAPGGSSSGSAVSVAAGFSPLAIGSETDGSVVWPALRAALYGLKATCGAIDMTGTQGGANPFFVAGGLAKSVSDLAEVIDVLIPGSDTRSCLTTEWTNTTIACVDPVVWRMPDDMQKRVADFEEQASVEMKAALSKIQSLGARVVYNAPLRTFKELEKQHRVANVKDLALSQCRPSLETYFSRFENSSVKTLEDFISFNKKHADQELPPEHANQQYLIDAAACTLTPEQFDRDFLHLRTVMRANIEECLQQTKANIIIAPGESILTTVAMAAGYPIAAVPVGFAAFNGRPFGMLMLARNGEECTLIRAMSAWEASLPEARKPPPLMSKP